MRRIVWTAIPTLCISVASAPAAAQQSALPRSQPLFESFDLLELRIEADFHALTRDVGEDRKEHPARLAYLDAAGDSVILPVALRTRGRFRRDRKICRFPPLRVDFQNAEGDELRLLGTIFEHQNELKLVCHCRDNRDEYDQFVLREYLVYRIYGLLTDRGFRVRLAHVTYVDTSGRRDSLTRYAFFIEDENLMAERLGSTVLDSANIRQMDLDEEHAALFAVFQYFVGNTDWKVSVGHNVKLLQSDRRLPIAVPYDFDWSGAVDPPYAAPHPELGTFDVKQRVFISPCLTTYDLERVLSLFGERKADIYALYEDQSGLDQRSRDRTLDYYDRFYRCADDPRCVRREFVRRCPGG